MTEEDLRREILNAIVECESHNGRSVVSDMADAKRLRDDIFTALSNKGLLKIDEG
jgi:hypothetical protein